VQRTVIFVAKIGEIKVEGAAHRNINSILRCAAPEKSVLFLDFDLIFRNDSENIISVNSNFGLTLIFYLIKKEQFTALFYEIFV
jgi:hypothetical protein